MSYALWNVEATRIYIYNIYRGNNKQYVNGGGKTIIFSITKIVRLYVLDVFYTVYDFRYCKGGFRVVCLFYTFFTYTHTKIFCYVLYVRLAY